MDLTNEIIGGKYDLKARLGGGGTASVWLAQRIGTKDRFAIKVIPSDVGQAQRLIQVEADMLRTLSHDHIVRFIDDGQDEAKGIVYLVLEYVDGTSIRDHVLGGAPSSAAILALFQQTLDAINHAHAKGIVHRDIKPDNIFVMTEDRPCVKVLDFGIAGIATTVAPQHTIQSFYTPLFAAPEQIRRSGVGRASDVYSTALLFLYLLAGEEAQDEMLRNESKVGLYEPARAALGDGEAAQALLDLFVETVEAETPDDRPALHQLQLRVREAQDEIAERITLPLYVIERLQTAIAEQEGYGREPGRVAQYVREALMAGNGRAFVSLQPPREGRDGGKDTISIGNGASGKVFVGHDGGDGYIFLKHEDSEPEVALQRLAKHGLRCVLDPQVAEVKSALHFDPQTVGDFIAELRQLYADGHQEYKEDQEQKNNQTFQQWERLVNLKKEILEDEKLPDLRYDKVEHDDQENVLRVHLARPVEESEFEVIETSTYPVTITVQDERAGRSYQASIGSIVGKKSKDGNVTEVEIGLSESVGRRLIDAIAQIGKVQTDLKAQEVVLGRERRAINDARFGRSQNPNLFHVLANPAKASPIQPVRVDEFHNERLDEAQREAVELALGTESLFLIQGPPGTGKTSVITEIVLQILQRHPSHRILITSQSNIAVDNVLEKVAAAREDLKVVRFGDAEKVDPSAHAFLLKPAVKGWQQGIAERAGDHWSEYAGGHGELVAGAEKVKDLQAVGALDQERNRLGEVILEKTERLNQPYNPSQHGAFESLSVELGTLLGERGGLEEELLAAIQAFAEKYDAQPPNGVLREWLDAEASQIKAVLGEENQNYDQFMERQGLLQEWLERLKLYHQDLGALFLERVNVAGATCIKVGSRDFRNLTFDWVIVDEAGRATPAETLVPAVKGRRVVLVGDHQQLPPVVDSELAKRAGGENGDWRKEDLEESLFEHLYKSLPLSNKRTLTNQYRMHPSIGNLVSKLFYEGEISSERVDAAEKAHGLDLPFESRPVVWVTTSETKPIHKAFHRKRGYSFYNTFEAGVVRDLLSHLQRAAAAADVRKEVGVITAYASQRSTLEGAVRPRDTSRWSHLDIVIHTVDGFQGKDRDIVIYNLVRSDKDLKLGFTSDYRRLNVALSRAKELLFVIGNDWMAHRGRVPRGADNPFRPLIEQIQQSDEYVRIPSQEIQIR